MSTESTTAASAGPSTAATAASAGPSTTATAASAGPSATAPRELTLRRLLTPSLFINAVAPAVIYQILTSRGLTSFNALVLVALFPIVGIAISLLRTHRVDAVGILSLAFITVGLVTSLLSGDERFLLLKESLITGAFGLVCLGSLLLPRPLMFYFGRSFSAGGDPAAVQRYDSLWAYPRFRHIQRTLTVGWGCGYVAEACLRVVLLAVLPITLFLAISQFLALGVTVLLLLWTVRYVRAARAQATAFGVQTP